MNILECYRRGIDYIENHLEDDFSIRDVANYAYLSLSYFQRIFAILSNTNVSDYIRSRRLSLAGQELIKNPHVKVIDLAFKYGYKTPESFSRAFYAFHHCLPSQVKSNHYSLFYYPRLEIVVTIKGGTMMDYQISEMKAFKIVVKVDDVPAEKGNVVCPKLWSEYWRKKYQEQVIPEVAVCFSMENNKDVFRYGIGGFIENVKTIPQGFETIAIPGQTYAKFKAEGAMPDAIQNLWKLIISEWLPNSNYEIVEAPDFEIYDVGDNQSPSYKSEVWIPVRLKQTEK
ncbi:MAG: AraC family transcriptional regulator [Bacilli bacterium]